MRRRQSKQQLPRTQRVPESFRGRPGQGAAAAEPASLAPVDGAGRRGRVPWPQLVVSVATLFGGFLYARHVDAGAVGHLVTSVAAIASGYFGIQVRRGVHESRRSKRSNSLEDDVWSPSGREGERARRGPF